MTLWSPAVTLALCVVAVAVAATATAGGGRAGCVQRTVRARNDAELAAALADAEAGTTVLVGEGSEPFRGPFVLADKAGTADCPVVVEAADGYRGYVTVPHGVALTVRNCTHVTVSLVVVREAAVGVHVLGSRHVTLKSVWIEDTSDAAVVLNGTTTDSVVDDSYFYANAGQAVVVGTDDFSEEQRRPRDAPDARNAVSRCSFSTNARKAVVLGPSSAFTAVTHNVILPDHMASARDWAAIFVGNSYGNTIAYNTIENGVDDSMMYIAIMVYGTNALGTESPTRLEQNFIRLYTEGYAILVHPNTTPATVCVSNIVTDTHYATPSNVPVDWSC